MLKRHIAISPRPSLSAQQLRRVNQIKKEINALRKQLTQILGGPCKET